MGKRKVYNTTLDAELMREIRILAAQLGKRHNDVLEEAIRDLLKKYKSQDKIIEPGNVYTRSGAIKG